MAVDPDLLSLSSTAGKSEVAPSVKSSDATVMRRGDGKFRRKDPVRIPNSGGQSARVARIRSTGIIGIQEGVDENGERIDCCCNFFRRNRLRWV